MMTSYDTMQCMEHFIKLVETNDLKELLIMATNKKTKDAVDELLTITKKKPTAKPPRVPTAEEIEIQAKREQAAKEEHFL